jgi:hypothetical protein
MPSTSPRLGLKRPVGADAFLTQDMYDNLTLLDGFPGIVPCTSGARPAGWGAAHSGMHIFETDTDLLWRWNGSAWRRAFPIGLLADPAEITTDYSTASTSPVTAITTGVNVPATNAGSTTKRIKVSCSFYGLDNGTSTTFGACEISLWRGATSLKTVLWRGRPTTAADPLEWGMGGTIEAYDATPAGAQTFTVKVNSLSSVGGTTTLRAASTARAHLAVEEVGL